VRCARAGSGDTAGSLSRPAVLLRSGAAVGVAMSTRCCAGMEIRRTGEEPAARGLMRLALRSGSETGRDEACLLSEEDLEMKSVSPELSLVGSWGCCCLYEPADRADEKLRLRPLVSLGIPGWMPRPDERHGVANKIVAHKIQLRHNIIFVLTRKELVTLFK
jgi:hypothetical protein